MTDLIQLICSAIATQEGFYGAPNNLPRRNHNPGNIRAAPWLKNAKIIGGYWAANSDAEGIAGLYHQVALNVSRGMNLRQLINRWAPASDGNNPEAYLANVMKWTGIADADVPLWNLMAIQKMGK